ncbi:MAG TPA: hypothetical protein VF494_04870 [Candidatus Limnocylindrales bacterium]
MDQQPAGLLEQLGTTIEAAKRLLRAHIDLAKAELGEIVDAVKRVIGLALGALALLFATLLLVFIGGLLFLGDWLFGSMGWGVVLGSLLLIDLAVIAALAAVDVPGGRLGRDLGLAVILGLVAAIVLEYDLAHGAWVSLGDSLLPGVDSAWRAVIVAVVVLAVVGALLGLILSARGGHASGGAAIAGAAVGVLAGLISAGSVPGQVGAALGVLVALIAWPLFSGVGVARRGIDAGALKAKFTPDETIDEAKETMEWLRARVPLAPKS